MEGAPRFGQLRVKGMAAGCGDGKARNVAGAKAGAQLRRAVMPHEGVWRVSVGSGGATMAFWRGVFELIIPFSLAFPLGSAFSSVGGVFTDASLLRA